MAKVILFVQICPLMLLITTPYDDNDILAFLKADSRYKDKARAQVAGGTYMLLPVGQNLPEAREELNPGPFSQRRRNVAKLNQSVQQRPRLRQAQTKDRCEEKKNSMSNIF